MPNANRPSGLSPVRYLNGAPWNGAVNLYGILAADTNSFAIGDIVKSDSGGATTRGIPCVTLGTAGAAARGVIVGLGILPAAGSGPYIDPSRLDQINRPSGAQVCDYFAAVVDDPNVIFEAQEINSGTPLAAADVGLNINLDMTGAGRSNTMKVSPSVLDNATEAVTATLNCKLLGLVQRPDNAIGAAAKWHVLINNHELKGGTGTAGV